ncbi:adenylyl-sulfate kinase [Maridesulfovibrio zosterae]|uniref:adenylyl-sulfate kinase n=1 Tax=Maridesulfovibrio zosterae TaxID=82171 RepID=UPI0005555BCC|nr:adenylyl-sulfate kinase [Maridesulfovibrio zosterae]
MSNLGKVIWLTGLSASGKSTIARNMQELLKEKGIISLLLDGDLFREAMADHNCGHDPESRILNAYRISRFANMAARQGLVVIVATMSLYHDIHNWNRNNFPDYFEVLIKADLTILQKRDPKGLYKHVKSGYAENLPGMDLKAEFPLNPDLIINNNDHLDDVRMLAELVIHQCGLY